MSRIDTIPPPPNANPGLFRWFTELRQALATEIASPAPAGNWRANAPVRLWRQGRTVHLSGLLAHSGTAIGTVMLTLPGGFRPAHTRHFIVQAGGDQPGGITIDPDGTLQFIHGDATLVSLDNIHFEAR